MIAVFIGPDDSETCNGCADAVDGNPYDVEDVPEPGEFECMSRCRHMIQIQGEDIPDDLPLLAWDGAFGLVSSTVDEGALADMGDVVDSIDMVDTTTDTTAVDTSDPVALAALIVDAGIDLEMLAAEADLTVEEIAAVQAELDRTIASASVGDMIAAGDVDILTQALTDATIRDEAIVLGATGLDNPEDAYTLRDALNQSENETYIVELQDDELWHVITEDQATITDTQLPQ